jgi:hypothetical protein
MSSVLLVVIPEAEPLVREHRLRLDPVTEQGVPAHVTELFPFVPRNDLDAAVLSRVAEVTAQHEPIDYAFTSTLWFEGSALCLGPDDPAPFVRLTEDLVKAFPDYPAYGGEFDTIVPHLTVARWTDRTELEEVERAILPGLPVSGRAEHLTLMTEADDGRWSVAKRFPLGGSR